MREKIVYELSYRDKGKEKLRKLEIDFVSNWCIREYNNIFNEIQDIKMRWDEANKLITDAQFSKNEKEDGWKAKTKKLESEIKAIHEGIIKDYANLDSDGKAPSIHEQKRFEIVTQLLEDNGIKNDDEIMSFDFWDRRVDPSDIIDFLSTCCWKDIDKKKMAG